MTSHLQDNEAAALEPVSKEQFLHVLTCPRCRSWVIGKLLDQCAADVNEDDTVPDYEPVFAALLEKNPAILDAARVRREEAEHLLEELLGLPPGKRTRALRGAPFESMALLDLLLERSHASQLSDPATAVDLGLLAYRLGERLSRQEEDAYAAIPRALALAANAQRLRRDLRSADRLLAKAAGFLRGDQVDRAFHCRISGLIRWEAGRMDEGGALLDRALLYYCEEDLVGEQGCTLALIGLLEEEQGQHAAGLPNLLKGWTLMDRQTRPGFAVRVGLTLALYLADVDQGDRARNVLKEVWQLSSHVKDASEWLRIYWGEARVLGRLGDASEAMEVLTSVRQRLEEEGSEAEADIVSVDVDLLLAEAGRLEETESLKTLLPQGFVLAPPNEPELRWREVVALPRAELYRVFRNGGYPMKPLPFA